MTAAQSIDPRHLVPRWRTLGKTLVGGELTFPSTTELSDLSYGLDDVERDWNINGTKVHAAEFAGAAIVSGQPERARETLKVLEREGGLVGVVGSTLREYLEPTGRRSERYDVLDSRTRIRRDPRNALAWLELSRIQRINGHTDAAQKSMTIAVELAPECRYILRSAGAFYAGVGDDRRALALLTPAAIESGDPWLISAEIAISAQADRRSKLIKKARAHLEMDRWDSRSASELSAEIATLELESGSHKKARKLFRRSLVQPTENALAQATFIHADYPGLIPENLLSSRVKFVSYADEAKAMRSESAGDFLQALTHARSWLEDQPFSSRAAIYSSYIAASAIEDWQTAVDLAERGLVVHPHDGLLLNNLAFALIQSGDDFARARQLIRLAEDSRDSMTMDPAIWATKGLLEYRSGASDRGKKLYEYAAASARKANLPNIEATALAMHAGEVEDRAYARRLLARAIRIYEERDPVLELLLERTRRQLS